MDIRFNTDIKKKLTADFNPHAYLKDEKLDMRVEK